MGKNRQFLSKHVRNEVGSFVEPEGDQFIVQLARSRGGNTMECECPDGSVSLFWLPSKFSKVIWAQRGDFLIVEPDKNAAATDSKVTGTIVHILFPEQVAHLRKLPCWPEGFPNDAKKGRKVEEASKGEEKEGNVETGHGQARGARPAAQPGTGGSRESGSEEEDESDDDDLFVNNNRNYDDLVDSDSDDAAA